MKNDNKFASEGDILCCQHCSNGIYKFVRDVQIGEQVRKELVEPIQPQEFPEPYIEATCVHCNKPHGFHLVVTQ